MARPQATEVRSTLNLVNQALTGPEMRAALAAFAISENQRLQASGEAPAYFTRYVNGREGAPESSVILPGPIIYDYNHLVDATTYGHAYLQTISPHATGEYARHWFVMENGSRISDFTRIARDSEIVITNDMPFSRKAETGGMRMSVPPGFVEHAQQAVMARFGNAVEAEVQFVSLEGGSAGGYPVPYILRRGSQRPGRTDADRAAGMEISYPALVIRSRFT